MSFESKISWPDDSKLVLAPLFLLESWPEDLGMAGSLNRGSDRSIPNNAVFKKDLSVIRDRWYGETVGIYRVLNILKNFSVQSTFFLNGRIASRNTQLVKLMKEAGHEVATETYDHTYSFMKNYEEEKADIHRSIEEIRSSINERPVGYLSPGLKPTFNTPSILVEEKFRYWVDLDDDEWPYWMQTGKGRILVIPNMRYLNDYSTFSESARTPEDLFKIWKDTFDYLYDESGEGDGRLMLWDNHIFITGRPNRSAYLAKFIKYVLEHKGTKFSRADQVANWCYEGNMKLMERIWDESSISPP